MRNSSWKRRARRRAAEADRPGLNVEWLEPRAVPAALDPGLFGAGAAGPAVTSVYTESNNPTPGQNAVLAFHQSSDGSLTQFGAFNTGGAGELNASDAIGPDAASQEVVTTADGRLLFAVNQGSNSVSSFRIDPDGTLHLVGTFASGGVQPDSIGIAGNKLYVSNRGDASSAQAGTVAPNITGFQIRGDGYLRPIPNSTVTLAVNTSPSQNLVSPDGRLLFADIFSLSSTPAGANTLAPFQIEGNGRLKAAPGGDVGVPATATAPAPPLLLGAAFNPDHPIIYAGLTAADQVAVFTYDRTGQLTLASESPPVSGSGPCWCVVSADGQFLYTGDTATDSIGVFSLANPLHPVHIQELTLGGPHAPSGSAPGTLETRSFELALSPDGHTLYAISQQEDPTGGFADGNQLHFLSIAADGTLSEPQGPVLLSAAGVPGDAHPQGVAVVSSRLPAAGPGFRFGPGLGQASGDDGPAAFGSIQTDAAAAFGNADGLVSGALPDFDEAELARLLTHLF